MAVLAPTWQAFRNPSVQCYLNNMKEHMRTERTKIASKFCLGLFPICALAASACIFSSACNPLEATSIVQPAFCSCRLNND